MAAASHPPGLIDTDVLIDAARKVREAQIFLLAQQQDCPLFVSVISGMELIVGCRNKDEVRNVEQFLATTTVLPVAEKSSFLAKELVASFWLSHSLSLPDAFIAATAREHGLPVYTRNLRHFAMIPELVVVRPY